VTVDQHEELRQLGCALARGPLYGAPLPDAATTALVASAAAGAWKTPVGSEERRALRGRGEPGQVITERPSPRSPATPTARWSSRRGAADQLTVGRDHGCTITALPAALDPGGTAEQAVEAVDAAGDHGHDAGAADAEHPLDQPLRQALAGTPAVSTLSVRNRWLQVHLCPGLDTDGVVTGAVGVAIDVTHRIVAEHALRDSEQRFRDVFAQAPVGMVILSVADRIVQVNPAFANLLGYSPDELTGRGITELWHPDHACSEPARDEHARDEQFATGHIPGYRMERVYRHRDGSPVWARVTVGPLAEGSPGTVICIVEDLGDVKRLEVELRHAQKLEAVGMLAAGIAHEINTPIQFIGDNINFLAESFTQVTQVLTAMHRLVPALDGPLAADLAAVTDAADLPWLLEEVPNAARQSLDGVARVATIVAAMRNFGHPDQRSPTPIDINAVIRDTATIASNEHKYVADLRLELGELPQVLGYPSEFHQVVLNLIVNAAHAISDANPGGSRRGTITVRSWADDANASVSVTDDGCGMTPETKARIFDPFFTTKEVGRGTGQGLTIVHSVVVDKHHGTVDVDTAEGRGTTITVRLPLVVAPDDGEPEPPNAVGP
jgi:PAS domain S-box-containing protein